MKKRFLSFLLVIFIICVTFVPSINTQAWIQYLSPSETKGSDYTDYPAFAKALDEVFAGDIDAFKEKSRKNEVFLPLGSRMSMNNAYHIYSTSRNVSTYGWTCFIYSNAAFNKLFGEYVHRGTSLKNCYIAVGKGASKMTYSLLLNNNIRPGAYIRTSPKSDGSYYGEDGHSMIILGYNETHITYLEGNGDGKGLVRVTKRTYNEFNSAQLTGRGRKITHIVQPTEKWFNQLYGNRPEYNTYTFSYDSNGGTGSQQSFTVPYGNDFSLNSSGFDRDYCTLSGWNIKRDTDNKWYTDSGWCSQEEMTDSINKKLFTADTYFSFDNSFIVNTFGNVSYTAYAVWENSVRQECVDISVTSSNIDRSFYPVGSTVSLSGSQLLFTFESGETVDVTVDSDCSKDNPQSFRYNGFEYSFYIESDITAEGANPCYVMIDSLKKEITSLNGEKTIQRTEMISDPSNISGEKAQIKVIYSDSTSEIFTANRFVPEFQEGSLVKGTMWTNEGFTIDWSLSVSCYEGDITVTYPSGYEKTTVVGDITLDGNITTMDLAELKLLLVKSELSSYTLYCAADINGDGAISSADLAMMKLYLAG